MTLFEKLVWYRKHYGSLGLLRKGMRVLGGERKITDPAMAAVQAKSAVPTIEQLLAARFFRQRPLRTYPAQAGSPQVLLVTDSVSRGSLFGGVATAILLAALVAERLGFKLRIVCRHERSDEKSVQAILAMNKVEFSNKISFSFLDVTTNLGDIDLGDEDIIITTSWWTTASTVGGLGVHKVFYLLQEDERMFYPHDDDHLRCSRLLETLSVKLIVNSQLLYRHLQAEGLPTIAERGVWFEPAFHHAVRGLAPESIKRKRTFFFYARPNHARNLFYLGLEVIQACVQRGVLDPDRWEFVFVGNDIPEVAVVDGIPVQRHEALPWAEYVELIRGVDLGLSLMYTPHPSYPPLDLAAAGAVVVTNTYKNKKSLGHYCENILCAAPDVESLLEAVARGVDLIDDRDRRARNLASSGLENDWKKALEPAIQFIVKA